MVRPDCDTGASVITIKRKMKKPFMQELVMHFPIFSNYRVTVLLIETPQSAGCYYADREYLIEPPTKRITP